MHRLPSVLVGIGALPAGGTWGTRRLISCRVGAGQAVLFYVQIRDWARLTRRAHCTGSCTSHTVRADNAGNSRVGVCVRAVVSAVIKNV